MRRARKCWAARRAGEPGFFAVCIDDPAFRKETAKDVARWIAEGAVVVRVAVERAIAGMRAHILWSMKKPARARLNARAAKPVKGGKGARRARPMPR